MRWLMVVLLVSLGGLLLAAAGVARHICQQRCRRSDLSSEPSVTLEAAEQADLEPNS